MKHLLSRILVAGVLATAVTGCGQYGQYGHHGHHGHHRASGVEVVATGILVGAAIASLASTPPQPERVYVSNTYYVNGPPPAPLPRSTRDEVKDADDLPTFDPQAARAALNGIDVAGCRAAGALPGYGHAKVTINPDGLVSKVVVDAPAGLSTDAAKCVGDRIGTATVAPFKGSLVTMGTTYHVP